MNLTLPTNRSLLALISICAHIYGLTTFGAVFWVDSIDYMNLGLSISHDRELANFYAGSGTWFFSHLQPGLPLLLAITTELPVRLQWPVWAISQHAIAALALYVFFKTLDEYYPSRFNLLGCLLVGFFPTYQAMHGAFMTESLNSSLLLLGMATTLTLLKEKAFSTSRFGLLLIILFLITQFRSYSGLTIVGLAFLSLLKRPKFFFKYGFSCLLIFFLAITIFPAYRYLTIGTFWLPSGGMNILISGWRVNPVPTDRLMHILRNYPFPDSLNPNRLINKGISYENAPILAEYWRTQGMTDLEINALAERIGKDLSNDSMSVELNRLAMGLASSGMVFPYCFVASNTIVFPQYSARQMCRHQYETYLFQAWIDEASHKNLFEQFFVDKSPSDDFSLQVDSRKLLASAMESYLNDSPTVLKNPLIFGWIPPDIWVVWAIVTLIFLAFREKYFVLMCSWVILLNFFVAFYFPVGNPRYAYSLFPIYFAVICIGAAKYFRQHGKLGEASR